MSKVVIVSGCRTAIGDYGAALKDIPPVELATQASKAAIERVQVDAKQIGMSVFGNVIHTEARDMYLARVCSVNAGLPHSATALTLNRLCGSGMQAIISATQAILLGDVEIALVGGAEVMSRAGYLIPQARLGMRMGDMAMVDMMNAALHDPFGHGHMGITAENVATTCQISRNEQDAFALESHRRSAHAIAQGYFKSQIIPIEIKVKGKMQIFDEDEHVRKDLDISQLQKLRPVFKKDGSVTAGNASGINDGAAALILMNESRAQKELLKPLARIAGYGIAGVDPQVMGLGPVAAVPIALHRAGVKLSDIAVIESNEAFASQACAVTKQLGFDEKIVNPNGGAVALGHPIGATGAMITIKLAYELERTQSRYGLATMCIGGGQGIAIVIENLRL